MENPDYLPNPIPGALHHQQILRVIQAHYASDDRISAVLLFGSMARGNWHERSDLDLDVVVRDDVQFDPAEALNRLCDAIEAEYQLRSLRIFRPPDSGDVVLSNLVEFSIRYHVLSQTSPNIIDAMWRLTGELDVEAIHAAGAANRTDQSPAPESLVDECIRYSLEITNAIERGHRWLAVELLHTIRGLLMQLFTQSQGAARPLNTFQQADAELQTRLAKLLSQLDEPSLKAALYEAITLLEHDLPAFTRSSYSLNGVQRAILSKIRHRLE